jgi:hypothetical protein
MGAGNVGLAFARWGSLNHAPFRALVYMAHRSLDSGNPPRFWGGREDLASALGRPIPEPYGEEFEKMRKADFEMVKKVIGALTKAGAITMFQAPSAGQNAVYTLNLRTVVDELSTGGGGNSVPPTGGNSVPRMVGTGFPEGGNSVPPLGGRGEVGLSTGVDGQGDQQPAGVARARVSEGDSQQFGEFDYRSAAEYLMTLSDADRVAADARAVADLPGAKREEIIIRAAQLAWKGIPA